MEQASGVTGVTALNSQANSCYTCVTPQAARCNTLDRGFVQQPAARSARGLLPSGFRLRVPYGTLLCVSDKPLKELRTVPTLQAKTPKESGLLESQTPQRWRNSQSS